MATLNYAARIIPTSWFEQLPARTVFLRTGALVALFDLACVGTINLAAQGYPEDSLTTWKAALTLAVVIASILGFVDLLTKSLAYYRQAAELAQALTGTPAEQPTTFRTDTFRAFRSHADKVALPTLAFIAATTVAAIAFMM